MYRGTDIVQYSDRYNIIWFSILDLSLASIRRQCDILRVFRIHTPPAACDMPPLRWDILPCVGGGLHFCRCFANRLSGWHFHSHPPPPFSPSPSSTRPSPLPFPTFHPLNLLISLLIPHFLLFLIISRPNHPLIHSTLSYRKNSKS